MKCRSRTAAFLAAIVLFSTLPIGASKLGFFTAHQDIGAVSKHGRVKYASKRDTYEVTGSGANIWGKSDAFHFVYEQVSGDVTLTADVTWVGQGTEAHRKAGLMIRQGLTADSPYVDVMIHGDGLTALQYRDAAGDSTKEMRSEVKSAKTIRIQKHGDEFTIAAGEDTDDLKPTGPIKLHLQDPVYIGFAVCSHNASVSETALFKSTKILTGPAKVSLNFPQAARF